MVPNHKLINRNKTQGTRKTSNGRGPEPVVTRTERIKQLLTEHNSAAFRNNANITEKGSFKHIGRVTNKGWNSMAMVERAHIFRCLTMNHILA